jgi:hypothetical protein
MPEVYIPCASQIGRLAMATKYTQLALFSTALEAKIAI